MLKLIPGLRTGARGYERFETGLAYIAGFILLVMGFTTFYEVMVRRFFHAPTVWSFELNMTLLLYFAFLGAGYCLVTGGHVRVDVLYARWSPRRKAAVDMVTFLLALLFIAILIWNSLDMALYSLEVGKRSLQAMGWPVFPLQIMIPIGGVLIGLQMIIKIVRDVHLVFFSASSESGGSQ